MSARRTRHEEHEEHENHERWLVTYADMVTLLMVLFIVMFAMSSVDQRKFNELKSGLAAGFGASTSLMDGSSSILSEAGTAAMAPIAPQLNFQDLPEVELAAAQNAVATADLLEAQRRLGEAEVEAERLTEVARRIGLALRERGLEDDVQAVIDERGLVLSLVSRHVVFEANMPTLSPRGRLVVDTLGPVLADLPDQLQIDGHTNQVPVKPKYFATDWDLSAARAITVLRRLDEELGLAAERLTMAAFGHEKPLMDPDEPGSQAVNKRVDIVVLSDLPPETRALLSEAVAGLVSAREDLPVDPSTTSPTTTSPDGESS